MRTERLLVFITALGLSSACAHRSASVDPDGDTDSGATFAAASSASPLPGADPAAILRERIARLQACYETLLKEDAELAGRFLLTLDVDPDGSVLDASLSAEDTEAPGAAKLEGCLHTSLAGTRFPPSEEGYLLEVPLIFAPKIVDPETAPAAGEDSPESD